MQYKCKTCSANGVETNSCTECISQFDKLEKGRCLCKTIDKCQDCSDEKTCVKCEGHLLINKAVSPNTCVEKCPDDTHKVDNTCRKGKNYA